MSPFDCILIRVRHETLAVNTSVYTLIETPPPFPSLIASISSLCKKEPLATAMSQGVKPSWMEAARLRSSLHTEGRGADEPFLFLER